MSLPARWKDKIVPSDPSDEIMELQMGPSHPASHGTIKFNLKLDGERIVDCDVEVGFLHRGFEKMCEQGTWTQCFPYTDRLNYASPCINNVGFALAVERLLGIDTTERCKYVRMIMSEVARIADHLTCLGMASSEVGATTVAFYMLEAREFLYDLIEAVTGARLTVTWCRVGGMTHDLPADFNDRMKASFARLDEVLSDCDKLLSRNRVFIDRMAGVGNLAKAEAISYGLTGPLLRATGVSYDVRKAHPYLVYDRMEFEVPVGDRGDNYDRFNVRFQEMYQSKRIIEQAIAALPEGPVTITDPKVVLPEKEKVYNSIEGLMNHFKLIMEGIHVPAGEVYQAVEGANGELGFYIVSDGSGRPYRVRVRPPCFLGMGALNKMLIGRMIPDIITTFGMINMIGGECDR
ncbi:MAG TPA: NADH-quinone oxidoreductase subunit D [Candidatus Acidoferrales bacterium]|jgi:NADH-quinone oxidoreductase subunit D|nr:NADH-quinone oxidoreductase subunit D [Candidatus Acidoferrum sp.]HXN12925.1 NADH-quinone oxidoreductase subunit D [Candidatus Acidoferrales bacterium]